MQEFFSKLKKINHPLLVFIVLGLRAGILGTSFGDALFLVGYLSFLAFSNFIESKRKDDLNDQVKAEISELKNVVSSIALKTNPKIPQGPDIKRFF
jgi:hypothetical protein